MAFYKTVESDVLVVGSGAAGFGASIKAKNFAENVVLVDKSYPGRSGCSPLAAGIWTIKFPEDDFEMWTKEIVEMGEYLNDQEWVKTFLERIYPLSLELDKWGEQYGKRIFEKEGEGNFIRRKSRGHLKTSHCLINSIPMIDTMKRKAEEKGVSFVERTTITDLVTSGDRVVGAIGFSSRTGDVYLFKTKALVVAAGKTDFGKLQIIKNLNGELTAAAYKVGAELSNLEMSLGNSGARDFRVHGKNLIVGVGGRFINQRGEEFMWEYDPVLGNRANMQTLCIAFASEVKDGRGPIYLDMSKTSPEDQQLMRKILPHSFKTWDRSGLNFFKDKIPWIVWPLFGNVGGIKVNTRCESNLPGLYAAGDAAGQPHHGTYSIGGLMISYAYLSGCIAGENAAQYANSIKDIGWGRANLDKQVEQAINNFVASLDRSNGIRPCQVIRKIQEILVPWPVSFIRSEERLRKALTEILQIRKEDIPSMRAADLHELVEVQGAKSLGLMAELFLRVALFRKESRGHHYREDYPYTDNRNWLKWVIVRHKDGMPEIRAEDVPTPYLRPVESLAIPPGVKKGGK